MSKSKILHKRKTPSVEGCIPKNNILTQTKFAKQFHSKHIYNYLKALNLVIFLSDVYLNHLLTIILSVFLRGYSVDFRKPLPQDNDRLFPESRKMKDDALQDVLKRSSKPFIGKMRSGQPIYCIVDDTIAFYRQRRFIQSKLRIFINHI